MFKALARQIPQIERLVKSRDDHSRRADHLTEENRVLRNQIDALTVKLTDQQCANEAIGERDAALLQLNAALAERDAAIADRDAVRVSREESHDPAGCTGLRIGALRKLPWYSINPPPDVISGRFMTGVDERRLLYTLARDYFVGAGRIIDGGAYLGSSALAVGMGLRERGYPKEPVIHSFDRFIIDEWSITHCLDPGDPLSQGLKPGDKIRHIYERNIAGVADYITVHEGDVTGKPWHGGPIEIVFNDVSKSWALNDHILKNWIPSLIPETGVLIQQDQIQEYHVWVAITMSMLSDYFETIDYTVNSSMVYRLKGPIPDAELDRCMSINVSDDDKEFHYKRSLQAFRCTGMGRYTGWHLGMVELGLAVLYGMHIGDEDKSRFVLRDCRQRFANVPDTMGRLSEIEKRLNAIFHTSQG